VGFLPGHPLKKFHPFCVEMSSKIFCKFGEFALGRCEDIACLQHQEFVGYKKFKKGGKIIECIAIGVRHLSVRRPKNAHNCICEDSKCIKMNLFVRTIGGLIPLRIRQFVKNSIYVNLICLVVNHVLHHSSEALTWCAIYTK